MLSIGGLNLKDGFVRQRLEKIRNAADEGLSEEWPFECCIGEVF
jgi:hypothetical protein